MDKLDENTTRKFVPFLVESQKDLEQSDERDLVKQEVTFELDSVRLCAL